LTVVDRGTAQARVGELLARLGGRELSRRHDAAETWLDVQVPAARYDDFVRGLESLGVWTGASRPSVLPLDPPQIRLTIRLE
jgi:hypothetical protein